MITTLGADYNSSTVFLGALHDDKVVGTFKIDITFPKTGIDLLRSTLVTLKEEWNLDKIWAEEAWVNGMRFPRSGFLLAKTAAYLEIACADTGFSIEFIHPMTWRKSVYGHARPANPKDIARVYVKELFGYETKLKKDHDICEAILLAHYGALRYHA